MSFADRKRTAQQEWQVLQQSSRPVIRIGTATCGRSAGAMEVMEVFEKDLSQHGIEAHIVEVGCLGLCYTEPFVCIAKPSRPGICYGYVTPEKAKKLIEGYLVKDDILADQAMGVLAEESLDPFVISDSGV